MTRDTRGLTRLASVWGPAVGVMAAIYLVSDSSSPPTPPGPLGDVGGHAIAYAALGVALLRGVCDAGRHPVAAGRAALAVALAVGYGVTDEWHQSFVPGRTPELRDLAADAIGATCAVGAVWAWGIVLANRRPSRPFRPRDP